MKCSNILFQYYNYIYTVLVQTVYTCTHVHTQTHTIIIIYINYCTHGPCSKNEIRKRNVNSKIGTGPAVYYCASSLHCTPPTMGTPHFIISLCQYHFISDV